MNKKFRTLLLIIWVYALPIVAQVPTKNYLSPPLDIPMVLSANFGELRSGHFHSGIDIKTQGRVGLPVYACAEGYISRISVSPGGFGKALYVAHPNGLTTVYGHLKSFNKEIEEYVREVQYREKSFDVNLFPPRDRYLVKRNELVALSGNSGSSQGPHLHFEVRRSSNQKPRNPLLYSFDIEDSKKPRFRSLFVYDLTQPGRDKFRYLKQRIPVRMNNDTIQLATELPIQVPARFGIGVEVFDYLDRASNRCAIYSLQVILDENQVYYHHTDEFSFGETRYVNSHQDYEERIRTGRVVHKTFLHPHNNLSLYGDVLNNGEIYIKDEGIHNLTVIVTDAYGNRSEIRIPVERSNHLAPLNSNNNSEQYSKVFPYHIENLFEHNGLRLNAPPNAFYDTLLFQYAKTDPAPGLHSPVHYLHNEFTPVHEYMVLEVKPTIEFIDSSKYLLVIADKDNEWSPVGGEFKNGYVIARIRDFGKYSLAVDTIAPEVKPVIPSHQYNMSGNEKLVLEITDDLSGIKSFHGYIDNQWVLFEYDPKSDRITYYFDPERLKKGVKHKLILTVTDERENYTVYHRDFIW